MGKDLWVLERDPDNAGRYAVWSSFMSDWVCRDLTESQVIEAYGEIGRVKAEVGARDIIRKLRSEETASRLGVIQGGKTE